MKKITNILKWGWFLNKRLYKKITFVLILALIPVMLLCYDSAAQEDSGLLTIALAREDEDFLSRKIMEDLADSSQLLRFILCGDAREARQRVENGNCDAAWIFREHMTENAVRFIASSGGKPLIQVVEREKNVSLALAREKLCAAVFKNCSREIYLDHLRKNMPELNDVSDEKLLSYYDGFQVREDLFSYDSIAGEQAKEQNYLTAPVRGLLGTAMVICGLAASVYYVKDRASGTFAWASEGKQVLLEFGCQMVSMLNVSAVCLISLALMKQTVRWQTEVLLAVMYCVMTAVFSMTVRRLCGTENVLAVCIPLLAVVMLTVCPVFLNLGKLRVFQYLFPPTYYINGTQGGKFLALMPCYTLLLAGICYGADKIRVRR